MPMSTSRQSCQTQIDENMILILRSKLIHRSGMYVTHSNMVIHSCAKHSMTTVSKRKKSCGLNTKSCHKSYKFDLEVKGQLHIKIMNVFETSSNGDIPMCHMWYALVKENRSYRPDTKT